MNRSIQALILLFVLTSVASAADVPSAERGKKLFNSTSLGTNGKSCASCHPGGKGMEEVAANDDKELAKISNQCLVKALKGKALADDSLDLSSLVMYQKTFGAAKTK